MVDDRQEQETPLYYSTKRGSHDRGLRVEVGAKAGSKIDYFGALSGALPNNRLNYRSNEAIKLDATSTLLIDAEGCTDQDNSDLEVICNRTYPKSLL